MEEDIKILEEYIKHDTDLVNLPEYDAKIVYKAIENLIARYKELEEENEQLEAIKNEAIRRYNFESIPKSKVKEKIEELDNERRKFTNDNVNNFYLQEFTRKYTQKSDHDYGVFSTPETITYCTNNELLGRVEVLQELLREE